VKIAGVPVPVAKKA